MQEELFKIHYPLLEEKEKTTHWVGPLRGKGEHLVNELVQDTNQYGLAQVAIYPIWVSDIAIGLYFQAFMFHHFFYTVNGRV